MRAPTLSVAEANLSWTSGLARMGTACIPPAHPSPSSFHTRSASPSTPKGQALSHWSPNIIPVSPVAVTLCMRNKLPALPDGEPLRQGVALAIFVQEANPVIYSLPKRMGWETGERLAESLSSTQQQAGCEPRSGFNTTESSKKVLIGSQDSFGPGPTSAKADMQGA